MNFMNFFSFVFLIFLNFPIIGSEDSNILKKEDNINKIAKKEEPFLEEVRISKNLFRGSYLIYDCSLKFFACVNDISRDKCKEKRDNFLKNTKKTKGCLEIIKFKKQKDCLKKQDSLSSKLLIDKFCINKKD